MEDNTPTVRAEARRFFLQEGAQLGLLCSAAGAREVVGRLYSTGALEVDVPLQDPSDMHPWALQVHLPERPSYYLIEAIARSGHTSARLLDEIEGVLVLEY